MREQEENAHHHQQGKIHDKPTKINHLLLVSPISFINTE